MKLTVRIVDVPSQSGGKALMLCDEHGEPLPNQAGCTLHNEVDDIATLDVRFYIGRDVTLA